MVLGNLGYSAGSLFSLHYFFHILGSRQASINDELGVNARRFSLIILKKCNLQPNFGLSRCFHFEQGTTHFLASIRPVFNQTQQNHNVCIIVCDHQKCVMSHISPTTLFFLTPPPPAADANWGCHWDTWVCVRVSGVVEPARLSQSDGTWL